MLQGSAKSSRNGVPAGRLSPSELPKSSPSIEIVFGHSTACEVEVTSPEFSSAVEVMILLVDPGAIRAVSAKSLPPSLFATARMSPVEGWITTIELCGYAPTACIAAVSTCSSMVVLRVPVFTGSLSLSVVPLMAVPSAFCSWISTPGVPPTGKYVEIPLVAIVRFRGDRLYNEHIYWDQASVLVQIGLLDPKKFPVAGVETAKKLVDESLPSNELMARWAESAPKV